MNVPVLTYNVTIDGKTISVYNVLFYKCHSQDGGGIYSEYDGRQSIRFCTFVNCSANYRGGAFLMKKGDVKISSCCAIDCWGYQCPDMICWIPTNVDLSMVQCYKSVSTTHLCFMSAVDILRMKYLNITKCESVYGERYGGITFGNAKDVIDVKYINVVKCKTPGTISYEDFSSIINTSFINAINNNNTCLIYLSYASSSTFNIYNSSFLDNNKATFYSLFNSNNNVINFIGCIFSFNEQVTESVTMNDCTFSFSSVYEPNNNAYCYQHSKYTCKYSRKKSISQCLFFVLLNSNSNQY
jgi:hypothetical protein